MCLHAIHFEIMIVERTRQAQARTKKYFRGTVWSVCRSVHPIDPFLEIFQKKKHKKIKSKIFNLLATKTTARRRRQTTSTNQKRRTTTKVVEGGGKICLLSHKIS